MSLSSMTGFAQARGHDASFSWTLEIKTVNGRSLDLRFRAPGGFDAFEPVLRRYIHQKLSRGTVQASLSVNRAPGLVGLRLNQALTTEIQALANQVEATGAAKPRLDALLSIPGMIEVVDPGEDPEARSDAMAAMANTLTEALDALVEHRRQEGEQLANVLNGQLDQLAGLVVAAAELAETRPDAIKSRLCSQIAELLEGKLPEERLAQEVALLLCKADIREELDRLNTHIIAMRGLIAAGGVVGRRLDFYCQELNREANTLCSKSGVVALTQIGLELKTIIDQLREQIQNIE